MNPDSITINLPVTRLDRAVGFYTQLGFEPHPVFRGPDCQCMVVSDRLRVMVHLASSLKHFTPKPIADPACATGVVLCLDCDSREQVDAIVSKALAAGGSTYDAAQDLGFIYTHGFLDTEGNPWRLNWMNPEVPMPS